MLFDRHSHSIFFKSRIFSFVPKSISGINHKRSEVFHHDPSQRVTCKNEHVFSPEISQDDPSLGIEFNEYRKIATYKGENVTNLWMEHLNLCLI